MFHGGELYSMVFWIAVVCFVLIGSYFSYKTKESQHRLLEKLAEKGQAISPEVLANVARQTSGGNHPLRAGIILMCVGVGLAVFLWAMMGGGGLFEGERVPNWLPVVGVIPFMVGVGLFVIGLFDRRSNK